MTRGTSGIYLCVLGVTAITKVPGTLGQQVQPVLVLGEHGLRGLAGLCRLSFQSDPRLVLLFGSSESQGLESRIACGHWVSTLERYLDRARASAPARPGILLWPSLPARGPRLEPCFQIGGPVGPEVLESVFQKSINADQATAMEIS